MICISELTQVPAGLRTLAFSRKVVRQSIGGFFTFRLPIDEGTSRPTSMFPEAPPSRNRADIY